MVTRRDVLASGLAAALPWPTPSTGPKPLLSAADRRYLTGLAKATVVSATRQESVSPVGFAVVTPGGNYPAFWIRDFSMTVDCGLLTESAILQHLRLIAKTQNGPSERRLQSGAVLPPWAVPDHINFDGRPVFYPGTYSSGEDQGGEPWGVLPPVDDHYEFVHIAYTLWKRRGGGGFLTESIDGHTLYDRLVRAAMCPETDPETGLVTTDGARRAVGFGFCDTVFLTGSLLTPSLLLHRAMVELAELEPKDVRAPMRRTFRLMQNRIRKHLAATFQRPDGWLRAATGVGRQPDVWGTALALHFGVLSGTAKRSAQQALLKAHRAGKLASRGSVRHVPVGMDFSRSSAWEKTAGVALDTYQNGAYWPVATGWLASALSDVDPAAARGLVKDYVQELSGDDFRNGGGAPWECFHPRNGHRQNPVYLASVSLPLAVLTGRA